MPAPSDLVHETASTTGTGNFTLSNVNGKRSFNTAFGNGATTNVFDYYIENRDAPEWERGTGHMSAASTLVRDTVKASSNSDAAVSFSAGTKDVVNDVPAARQVYTDESGNIANSIASINSGPLAGFRNAIINGAFMVAQRGTSFTDALPAAGGNNDDTYNLDRWTLLSDGNDVVDVSQDTADVPTNGLYAAKMLVVTVNKKFGLLQIIEQKNCIGLIGNTVTLSFKAKVNNTTRLDKIKAAIISWSGTADTVTSDIISAWGTDGTTPTLVANWTFENTPVDLGVTTSWASYSVSGLIDTASTTNIAVFIWSDNVTDTDAADTLAIADVQLEVGSTATPFERRRHATELMLARRYYLPQPGALSGGWGATNTTASIAFGFPVPMFAAPTITLINGTGAALQISVAQRDVSAVVGTPGIYGGRLDATTAAAATQIPCILEVGTVAFIAEL